MLVNINAFEIFIRNFQQSPCDIKVDDFRDLIRKCSDIVEDPCNLNVDLEINTTKCNLILDLFRTLDNLLLLDFPNNEVQYVCGTALCSVINILPLKYKEIKLDHVYDKMYAFSEGIDNYIDNINVNPHCIGIMALVNGVYHSNVIFSTPELWSISEKILVISMEITLTSCMSYNVLTSMCFRNMNTILTKVLDWNVEDKIPADLIFSLLKMLYSNWENPLTNIREMICRILSKSFQILRGVLDHYLDNLFLFPWNKGKYYTLCELIPCLDIKRINYLLFNSCCIAGLRFSLQNQCLVSAGAGLYRAMLDKYHLFDEWYTVFYKTLLELLMSKEHDVKRNVLTYWMPLTIKQFPQVIFMLLNVFYEHCYDDDGMIYSFLFLLKLSRKAGHSLKLWRPLVHKTPEGEIILRGLSHKNDDVRMQAIQVITSYSSSSTTPTADEMEIMIDFLRNNINCDSSPFRQNTLKSFTMFLIIMRDSFINFFINKKNKDNQYMYQFEYFFTLIYEFILENLSSKGNYQRKVTAIHMFKLVMKFIQGGYSNDEPNTSATFTKPESKLVKYLEKKKKWRFNDEACIIALINSIQDCAKDVKDVAVQILVQYYLKSPHYIKVKNDLFKKGIVSCNSKMFYEVDSGIPIFKLIGYSNAMENNFNTPKLGSGGTMKMIDYFNYKITEQFDAYKLDILSAINNGQPLFGIMSAMNAYIKSPGIVIEGNDMNKLIFLITEITSHVLDIIALKSSATDKQVLPSFAEINESIIFLIEKSQSQTDFTGKDALLSDLCKLVMNNIWLTLKICCEVSNTIITNHHKVLKNDADIGKCLNIYTSVLRRCRLKGAIEFAGISLGSSIKFITSLPDNPYQVMLSTILEEFLSEVTCEYYEGSSITRKSAGLSILLHRLVASDSRTNKPLYHTAMKILLRNIKSNQPSTSVNKDSYKDIPRATILHILCRIINDSTLSYANLQYILRLTILCFKYINSEQWQIRNAALQLYGALVLRLVGQQQSQSPSGSTESSLSVDELFSHYPKLWQYVSDAIKAAASAEGKHILMSHSNLIPILSLLSHTGRRYLYRLFELSLFVKYEKRVDDRVLNMPDIDTLFTPLNIMLGSPIYAVRNLCANIIEIFYSADVYYNYWALNKNSFNTDNLLHGNLLVLRNYIKFHERIKDYLPNQYAILNPHELERMIYETGKMVGRKDSSLIVKALYVETMFELKIKDAMDYEKCLQSALSSIQSTKFRHNLYSGLNNWIHVSVYNVLLNCEEKDLLKLIDIAMSEPDLTIESIFSAIKKKITRNNVLNPDTIKQLILVFINRLKVKNDAKLGNIEMIYLLSQYGNIDIINIIDETTVNTLLNLIKEDDYDQGYLLPLICCIITSRFILTPTQILMTYLEKITLLTKNMSNVNFYDEEKRLYSAMSVKHLAKIANHQRLNNYGSKEKIFLIKYFVLTSTILLLQDEDTNVRNECSKVNFFDEEYPTHPTRLSKNMLSSRFFERFFNADVPRILKFFEKFKEELKNYTKIIPDENLINPFENDSNNTYWELELIQDKLTYLLKLFRSKNWRPAIDSHNNL